MGSLKIVYVAMAVMLATAAVAVPTGRRLSQFRSRGLSNVAKSTATATATGGGSATANSAATTDGDGVAVSNVAADATDGADVTASGSATSVDGATAVTDVKASGDDGATVTANADTVAAGPEAEAAFSLVLGASGDVAVQADAFRTAIQGGNGVLVSSVLELAQTQGGPVEKEALAAVAFALAEANRAGPEGATSVGRTIVTGVNALGAEKSTIIGRSVSMFLETEGCKTVQDAIREADVIATANGKFVERAFVQGMSVDPAIATCIYPVCKGEIGSCCSEDVRSVGQCMCDSPDPSASCKYRLFWQIPKPQFACSFDRTDCREAKCICGKLRA